MQFNKQKLLSTTLATLLACYGTSVQASDEDTETSPTWTIEATDHETDGEPVTNIVHTTNTKSKYFIKSLENYPAYDGIQSLLENVGVDLTDASTSITVPCTNSDYPCIMLYAENLDDNDNILEKHAFFYYQFSSKFSGLYNQITQEVVCDENNLRIIHLTLHYPDLKNFPTHICTNSSEPGEQNYKLEERFLSSLHAVCQIKIGESPIDTPVFNEKLSADGLTYTCDIYWSGGDSTCTVRILFPWDRNPHIFYVDPLEVSLNRLPLPPDNFINVAYNKTGESQFAEVNWAPPAMATSGVLDIAGQLEQVHSALLAFHGAPITGNIALSMQTNPTVESGKNVVQMIKLEFGNDTHTFCFYQLDNPSALITHEASFDLEANQVHLKLTFNGLANLPTYFHTNENNTLEEALNTLTPQFSINNEGNSEEIQCSNPSWSTDNDEYTCDLPWDPENRTWTVMITFLLGNNPVLHIAPITITRELELYLVAPTIMENAPFYGGSSAICPTLHAFKNITRGESKDSLTCVIIPVDQNTTIRFIWQVYISFNGKIQILKEVKSPWSERNAVTLSIPRARRNESTRLFAEVQNIDYPESNTFLYL
jgi:hypothetical protein